MTDRQTLYRLIEELPDSQLVAAEDYLTYLLPDGEEVRQTLTRLGGPPLYDTDFYTWTQEQAAAIRARLISALDIEHLAEEIETLGRSERESIENRLQTLLTHLLKWRYDPATEPRRGWRITIRNARKGIAKKARASLKYYPEQYLAEAYGDAREDAADETNLPLAAFPEVCPWTLAQVLDKDFWPEASSLS
jgi:hypothetical protein